MLKVMETYDHHAGVQGVVLDGALFHHESSTADAHFEKLLFRLFYSHIRVGVLFCKSEGDKGIDFRLDKIDNYLLSDISIDIKKSSNNSVENALKEFSRAWELAATRCIFFSLSLKKSLKDELVNQGWHICLPVDNVNPMLDKTINHIQGLYNQIACINKESDQDLKIVGYSMKWSREMDFLKRGALPLNKLQKNLCFLPVNLDLPLSEQCKLLDIMLHKPTDEILNASLGEKGSLQDQIRLTDAMRQSIASHPEICVVDPIERILPLVDRALTQEILQGLPTADSQGSKRIRAPRYKRVLKFDCIPPSKILEDCGFSLPAIIKPQVACGVSNAHIMAVVFNEAGFLNLDVPTPSVIQEYVDHGSTLYKFYVIGENLFYSVRNSTPNAAVGMDSTASSGLPPVIVFDSLKSLPKNFRADQGSMSGDFASSQGSSGVDLELVSEAASWLQEKLKLTIFGFDVVIELATGDHVIIDMNFFPTFKDVDEQIAIPAFWNALLRAHAFHNAS
ncbi:hypothetical protein KP509_20G000100 [Ceratopteris richardii]|uniref:Uncharacterized protein n=1 Tax=Ceratopteris richardii TaxID=49495 RepID=A0A8T2SE82_CERRI|nr:hypothetical protein KP509_20G000100 [Ceratopteris richardii]